MSKQKRTKPLQNIPTFIQKLCNILQDESCQDYVQWTSTEDSFNIKDVNRFTDVVLPKYFKHSNFSSFIRQLNMYGFNKVRHEEGENVYTNQNFKKGQKQLLPNIKRKINQSEKQDKLAIYSPASSNNLGKQLNDLKSRQRNLQSMCKQLIDQNNRILEQNNLMMKRLTTQQKEKNSKMEQLLVSLIMARGSNQLALPSSEETRMLSLTNQAKPDYGGTNFQDFCEFLEQANGNSRLQEALRKFQNQQKKRNKSKNYTIVNQIEAQSPKPLKKQQSKDKDKQKQKQKQRDQKKQPKKIEPDEHEHSMLSLSDFLNLGQESPAINNGNIEPPI